ncbi:hypothetical protein [Pedobacter sp. CG_S7]|uniref:hypothetical protein n=1 Tax=Pedobacter sp. CG_S7 TaxID=3143930 RepID=UPI0033985905
MNKGYKIKTIKVPRFKEANGFYTTPQNSKAMSKIRGKNTKPEIILRKAFWAKNFRYRIHVKNLPGKPDIDGEFWHGYKWEEKKLKIKTNIGF